MIRAILLTFIVFFIWFEASPASGEGRQSAFHLRSEYLRLRNLDASGDQSVHSAKWVALANNMHGLFLRSPKGLASRDLFFAADTHFRLFHQTRTPGYLVRTKSFVEAILSSASTGELEYGEALLLRGDIGVAAKESLEASLVWYKAAAKSSGRLARRAQDRIQSLANGTFGTLIPTSDLEVPRLIATSKKTRRAITKRIVIDPGHGGFDGGAEGRNGLVEKELTLDIARRVKTILERDSSIAVLLTREDDVFVPLARRTGYANRRRADAFVSLHLNASPGHSLHGLEAYYLDTTDDEASRLLAERENGMLAGEVIDDLSFILSDLVQSGKLEGSVELSHFLEASIHKEARGSYREAKSFGVKKGGFFVLVGAHMPCSLIELFFIDNPLDGAKLATDHFRTIVAQGIARGLSRFTLPGKGIREETPLLAIKGKPAKPARKQRRA